MIRAAARALRRFVRAEDGSATVEFSIVFLPMFAMLFTAVELGMINIRHSTLERAMDLTVRDIRLGTGAAPQHNQIKNMICLRAGFINDCDNSLRLEMIPLNPRAWAGTPATPDCTDQSQPVAPVRSFTNGIDNELMFLRACAKLDPVFPNWGLGDALIKDAAGQYALIATAIFVQEPR